MFEGPYADLSTVFARVIIRVLALWLYYKNHFKENHLEKYFGTLMGDISSCSEEFDNVKKWRMKKVSYRDGAHLKNLISGASPTLRDGRAELGPGRGLPLTSRSLKRSVFKKEFISSYFFIHYLIRYNIFVRLIFCFVNLIYRMVYSC